MPRDLGDVLDYFLPVASAGADASGGVPPAPRPRALPILTLPVLGRDVVRAAFAWNLTVELARLGARAILVAPRDPEVAALWPDAGAGPVGAEVVYPPAHDGAALGRAALEVAVSRADNAPEGGIVVVTPPPAWLMRGRPVRPLLRWLLLLGRPERNDLLEIYALAKHTYQAGSDPLVGVTIHGVQHLREAERAFGHLAGVAARHLGRTPQSYGLLADDLHVYRAVAARRPIGLEHPQSRAARALGDVARMLWEDARKMTLD